MFKRITRKGLSLAVCLAVALCAAAAPASAEVNADGWISFLLICNEGMNNNKGNAGNTLMAVSMHPDTGDIRLMMLTWDTFIDYEGYDVPQKLDIPYRNNGPEEAMRVLNANFDLGLTDYMSLNFLNLASLIDAYGGVTVNVTRPERNALNDLVSAKKQQLLSQEGTGFLTQTVLEMLAEEYYLSDFGPETHLNGMQAVAYGWLQYDSVYNCCQRDMNIVASLFHSVAADVAEHVAFYTEEYGYPEDADGRRAINPDAMTEEDMKFLRDLTSPIFQMSYNNLEEEEIETITRALARVAYRAARQGVNIFDSLRTRIFPLEAKDEYEIVAGTKGHVVDKAANAAEMARFLYSEE